MTNADAPAVAPFEDARRVALIGRAFRLEWFTLGWMTIEAAIAITAGVAARSVSLTVFGVWN
jgi:hypothetical protein